MKFYDVTVVVERVYVLNVQGESAEEALAEGIAIVDDRDRVEMAPGQSCFLMSSEVQKDRCDIQQLMIEIEAQEIVNDIE